MRSFHCEGDSQVNVALDNLNEQVMACGYDTLYPVLKAYS
jgi:hypothetical protein